MFELFNQGWFGSLIGLLGLSVGLIGLLLYFNGKIGARPTCQMRSLRLLGKEEQALPPEIKIHFKSKNIPRLTLTTIFLWNGGKESIRGNQIVQDDPLRCEFEPSDEILKAKVAACTRAVNKVALQIPASKPYTVLIDFDYLDPADGARIDILHTSKLRYPQLLGCLRGIPKGVTRLSSSPAPTLDSVMGLALRKRRFLYGLMLVIGIVSIIVGSLPTSWLFTIKTILNSGNKQPPSDPNFVFRFATLGVGCVYVFFPLLSMWGRRKRHPAALDLDNEDKQSGKEEATANGNQTIRSEIN
jgi:hypothetical protein